MPDQRPVARLSWLPIFHLLVLDLKQACMGLAYWIHVEIHPNLYHQKALDAEHALSSHVGLLLDALPDPQEGGSHA